ncbi:Modification methylase MjaII [uncultured archaeon]|nr:Modification methylase MjaII [uncultured archaeon]
MVGDDYVSMREVKNSTYKSAKIGDSTVSEKKEVKILQPKDFELQYTTVWSFPKRGEWATHKGDYRGNWAPEIPRNLILRYSKQGDTVLDQMVGGGTTLIECKLLGRNGIGVDINPDAIMITHDRLKFDSIDENFPKTEQKTYVGDARNLDLIKDESIDFIATHPPYLNIIPYTQQRIKGDLSSVHSLDEFIEEMKIVAKESFRVLIPDKYCGILIGDTRRHKHYIPVSVRVLSAFLEAGFILKEDVTKQQWNVKTTGYWAGKSKKSNFLLIMHEHLYIFRKPEKGEKTGKFRDSMKA